MDEAKETVGEAEVEATAPPIEDPKTGVAMSGDYPFNHRLRAEALSKAGKTEDPDGLVSPELIVDAGERLESEAAAEAELHPPVSSSMSRKDLDALAIDAGLDPSQLSTKDDVVAAIEEARAPVTDERASGDPVPPAPKVDETENQEG